MTRPRLKWVALEGAVHVVSSLTRRSVWVNSAMDKFSLMPGFSTASLASARKQWSAAFANDSYHLSRHERERTLRKVESIFTAPDRDTFASAIDGTIAMLVARPRRKRGHPTPKKWVSTLQLAKALVLCSKHELLLFPPTQMLRSPLLRGTSLPEPTAAWCGKVRADLMRTLSPALQNRPGLQATAFRFLLTIGGLKQLGDIGPEIFEVLRPVISGELYQHVRSKDAKGALPIQDVCETLLTLQREQFAGDDGRLQLIPRDRFALRFKLEGAPPPSRGYDRTFSWIAAAYPDKSPWREAAAAYLASLYVLATQAPIKNVNQVLLPLFAREDTPSTPLAFCRTAVRKASTDALRSVILTTDESGTFVRSPIVITRHLYHLERFFDLLLETHAVLESGALDPSYKNPVAVLWNEAPKTSNKGETDREAIPDEVKEALIEVLTTPERDPVTGRVVWTFAWAKNIDGDHFTWVNPDTKKAEKTWSPVRALAVLFMLHSPLRGLQLRFLGSGEGDPEVWVPAAKHPRGGNWGEMWAPSPHDVHGGNWVQNTSKWAPPLTNKNARVQPFTGVLRRFKSDDGTEYLGAYVSTNKTADLNVNPEKFGYEIPLILPVNLEFV